MALMHGQADAEQTEPSEQLMQTLIRARWVLSPQRHRDYVAGWLKALRNTTRWLPRGRHRIRRFGRRTFIATLSRSNRR